MATLAESYDEAAGGFGGAPKFPPSMVLEFLLRHTESARQRNGEPSPMALRMVEGTAGGMARGGLYDQLAGGFARYSVDAGWVVPHFEKMLYDNALLARVYAHLWRRTGSALARRVARETCAWMIAELGTAGGRLRVGAGRGQRRRGGPLLYVDTGRAGRGPRGRRRTVRGGHVRGDGAGTFEHGRSVLQRRAEPDDPARFGRIRDALLAVRGQRVRPGRDDKVVAAWNGLAIAALAETGLLLGEPAFVAAAQGAAELLARVHRSGGRLARTSRDGVASGSAGVLDDYGCVADGLLALSGVTGEARWVALAGELLDTALARFGDGSGGFYDTADDGEPLVYRPADPADGPSPSGAFAVAGALLSYSALTGSAPHREAAAAALAVVGPIAARFPRAAGSGLAVAEALISGPAEVAIVGPARRPAHRRAAAGRPARGPARRGARSRRRTLGRRDPAARGARPGRRGPGRLRLPGLRLSCPGDRAGGAARGAAGRLATGRMRIGAGVNRSANFIRAARARRAGLRVCARAGGRAREAAVSWYARPGLGIAALVTPAPDAAARGGAFLRAHARRWGAALLAVAALGGTAAGRVQVPGAGSDPAVATQPTAARTTDATAPRKLLRADVMVVAQHALPARDVARVARLRESRRPGPSTRPGSG